MNFDRFFKLNSYAVVLCGFLALFVAGGAGALATALFAAVFIAAWFLENSRRQLSERLGTAAIFIIVPLFYAGWHYKLFGVSEGGAAVVGMLARMILILAAIKLLQKKADRDWLFLYLMTFFEVLLAAGLSISPLYLAALILYLLATVGAIVLFEIKKTSRTIAKNTHHKPVEKTYSGNFKTSPARFALTATALLFLIVACGTPLFFALPRGGGSGLGSNSNALSNLTGFSDSVNLGEIGRLLQSDQIVMRARLEGAENKTAAALKWRGVALDNFDNKRWSKSKIEYSQPIYKEERDFFLLDYASGKDDLTVQTIYLEPFDTPALFTVSRPVAVQGNFKYLRKDSDDAVLFQRNDYDRLSYKVYSDTTLPNAAQLKSDNADYQEKDERYLQLPDKMDGRIAKLTEEITAKSSNRYEKAKAVERYLQTQFGYSLQMRAAGDEPLADFLFNIREGHCEYFASAMAVMLRTQGIATRIVNGFQQGEYNDTADVFVIKQKDAHSWTEVYFPQEDVWIPFDPTPFARQDENGAASTGIVGKFNKYLEALETFWIQYFVSYDNQEQRSLVRSFRNGFSEYQSSATIWLNGFRARISEWWKNVRGDQGLQSSAAAIAYGIGYFVAAAVGIVLMIWLYRKIKKLRLWRKIYDWAKRTNEATIIEFYERMQTILANKGVTRAPHQTPLEFAFALGLPEAVKITEKYHRVRFGEQKLSADEAREIENWLRLLEEKD